MSEHVIDIPLSPRCRFQPLWIRIYINIVGAVVSVGYVEPFIADHNNSLLTVEVGFIEDALSNPGFISRSSPGTRGVEG